LASSVIALLELVVRCSFDSRENILVSPIFLAAPIANLAPHRLEDPAALETAKACRLAPAIFDRIVEAHLSALRFAALMIPAESDPPPSRRSLSATDGGIVT
jgi:hypothetical protein